MGIKLHKESKEAGATHLFKALADALSSGQRVLWLLSGGSNVAIEREILGRLTDTEQLFTALIDERYGERGHKDSNYEKLRQAGFIMPGQRFPEVLRAGLSLEQTRAQYEKLLAVLLEEVDVVIGQLGIGADGHIAGVLPHSVGVGSDRLVESYVGQDFQRITLTLAALKRFDQTFVFCYGADKESTLERLLDENAPLSEQPAQILKHIPSVYLYNDQLGGDE